MKDMAECTVNIKLNENNRYMNAAGAAGVT